VRGHGGGEERIGLSPHMRRDSTDLALTILDPEILHACDVEPRNRLHGFVERLKLFQVVVAFKSHHRN
jgi:hypothetical protein